MKRRSAIVGILAYVALVVAVGLWNRSQPGVEHVEPKARSLAKAEHPSPGFPPPFPDARPAVPVPPGVVEMCGYGLYQVEPTAFYPPSAATAADAALERATAALATSEVPREKAAGLYVQLASISRKIADGYVARQSNCFGDPACTAQVEQAIRAATEVVREQLAAHAIASRDPQAYALAWYACGKWSSSPSPPGTCALISSAQWAQIEPDNAIPWLIEARAAAARKDAAASETALRRAALAPDSRLHWNTVFAVSESQSIRSLAPAARLVALSTVMGTYAAFPLSHFQAIDEYCGPKVVMDDQRRRLCSDLASTLAEHGDHPAELGLSARIGERSGWPKERVERVRERLDAISQSDAESMLPVAEHWSCASLDRRESRMRLLVRLGDVRATEETMKLSGQSTSEMAARWRAGRAAR